MDSAALRIVEEAVSRVGVLQKDNQLHQQKNGVTALEQPAQIATCHHHSYPHGGRA